jgi:hypothetical protein
MFRQKDICGEWVPESEPANPTSTTTAEVASRHRWEEIDDNMMLHHVTSKRQKAIDIDLRKAPMALRELEFVTYRPPTGPIIINDVTGLPWSANEFRGSGGLSQITSASRKRSAIRIRALEPSPRRPRPAPTWSTSGTPRRTATSRRRNATAAAPPKKIEAVQDKRLAHRYRNDG